MKKNLLLFFFIISLLNHLQLFSQTNDASMAKFTLSGIVKQNGKPIKGVTLELTKDGKKIAETTSQRNGKYSIEMSQSTGNAKSEYHLYISKEGTISKTLHINTAVPKEEYTNTPNTLNFDFNIIESKISGVVLNFYSGKIKWVSAEHGFSVDQENQKMVLKEEKKMETNLDAYLLELTAKKKIEKENNKRTADSLAKVKVEAKANAILELKKEEEGAKRLKQSIFSGNNNQPVEIHTPENNESAPTVKQDNDPVLLKKITPATITLQTEFDGTTPYSLNSEKSFLKNAKNKMERKKSANYALKYETRNSLTSLLDAVDEHDKKEKK